MFQVITGRAQAGGTLALQAKTFERAKEDLQKQLNAFKETVRVQALSVYQENAEVQIIAVVETIGKTPVKLSKEK